MTKEKLNDLVDGAKHESWRWLGALVMTTKKNAQGEQHLAVSLSKVQKLVSIGMAVALFITMLVLWIVKPEMLGDAATATDPIPASMERCLWGLLGLSGVNTLASAVNRSKESK